MSIFILENKKKIPLNASFMSFKSLNQIAQLEKNKINNNKNNTVLFDYNKNNRKFSNTNTKCIKLYAGSIEMNKTKDTYNSNHVDQFWIDYLYFKQKINSITNRLAFCFEFITRKFLIFFFLFFHCYNSRYFIGINLLKFNTNLICLFI